MEFIINKDGILEIKRAGEFKDQYCPFDIDSSNCGDWCPLFDEPEYIANSRVKLKLCKTELTTYRTLFQDLRITKK